MKNPFLYYRLARWLFERNVPLVPSLITLFVRLVFSCYIPHTSRIGGGFVPGYGGLGVVIGGNVVIGDCVEVGAGVVVGGNATESGMPHIGANVYVGAGAKILGPIFVGENTVIAANSVLLESVPANCVVAGIPGKIVKENIEIDSFLYHRKGRG